MAYADWEYVDGIFRWVWALDELLAREFPKRTTPDENMEVVRIARTKAKEMGVSDFWLGQRLQDCRQKRNERSGVLRVVD